jgi:hypothetical protein
MAIVPVTDHAARAVAALVEQYKTKPKMMGLLTALVNQVQDIEDALDGTAPVGTNLVGQSESVSTGSHLTITQNALVAPNGKKTGQQWTEDTAVGVQHFVNGWTPSLPVASIGDLFTTSCHFHAGNCQFIDMGVTGFARIKIDLANRLFIDPPGNYGAYQLLNTLVLPDENGWLRYAIAFQMLSAVSPQPLIAMRSTNDSTDTYTGTSRNFGVWGMQVEKGVLTPGIYNPTGSVAPAYGGPASILGALVLDSAYGPHLDVLGRIVGELRNGRTDPSYRTAIQAKILLNKSSGTIEEIYAIFALLLAVNNLAATMRVQEFYPKALALRMGGVAVPDSIAADMAAILKKAKDAGALAHLEYGNTTPLFGFDGAGSGFDTGYLGGSL